MASRSKRLCGYPGCNELVDSGYCDRHKQSKRQYDRLRGTAARRGYDDRWRKYRERFIRDNPFCVECLKQEKYEPTTDVDHIIPVKGQNDPMFWKPSNHQGLCHAHHSAKTARENGGYGNTPPGGR